MSLSILFSSSFLFSIAAILVLAGAIFAYVTFRMSEQDHKLNSMLGLITTIAGETQYFRNKIGVLQQHVFANTEEDQNQDQDQFLTKQNDLISVSDEEEYDESEGDSEDESEDGSEDEDDSEDEGDDDSDEDEDNTSQILETLNLSLGNIDITNNDDIEVEELANDANEIKTVHLDLNETLTTPFNIDSEITHFLENNEQELNSELTLDQADTISLKNIQLNGNNETDDASPEYKKMPLQKLKEIAVAKGLVTDASKLKKHDLLKIIEH